MIPVWSDRAAEPPRILVLVGPTTSGKTALSLQLAERLGAEIISMDSRQVYRGMDIGTDKVALSDRARVPHHGLDLIDPDERYSAGRFGREARTWIEQIGARGRVPLLVGGTGFFLKALLSPIFDEPHLDPERREALRAWLNQLESDALARWTAHLDEERAPVAIGGGRQRMQRVIEVALLTGRPLSEWHRVAAVPAPDYRVMTVLLNLERAELDRRIDERVEGMVGRGLLKEIEALAAAGYRRDDPGLSGTGYREMWDVRFEARTLDEAKEAMKSQTRQYARRQLTWFRHQLDGVVVPLDASMPVTAQVAQVVERWTEWEGGA